MNGCVRTKMSIKLLGEHVHETERSMCESLDATIVGDHKCIRYISSTLFKTLSKNHSQTLRKVKLKRASILIANAHC